MKISMGNELVMHTLLTYVIFWLAYFHFWLDLTLVVLSFVPLYFKRVYLHEDPLGDAIINAVMMLPWHVLNLFFIHWVITKVGFLYTESEVLRRGNESILDNLQEGVVIFEEQSQEILYYNAAATLSHKQSDQFLSVLNQDDKPKLDKMYENIRQKRLSWIEKSVFYASVVDYGATK